jgi:hypothetical protein
MRRKPVVHMRYKQAVDEMPHFICHFEKKKT